jgi:DNA-binding NtrC family response regulator
MKNQLQILILDDEKQFTEELNDFFVNASFNSFQANTVEEGRTILASNDIDLLFLDVRLPGVNGLDILEELKQENPEMEVIIVSAHMDMDTISTAISLGAFDYLRKPFRYIDMQITIERAQKYLQSQRKLEKLGERLTLIRKYNEGKTEWKLIAASEQMKKVYQDAIEASKQPDMNVLITGEGGTGKENVARIIHDFSIRKDFMFCPIKTHRHKMGILESDYFGYANTSLSKANTNKMGFLEVCHGGTLFLDEIAALPIEMQEKIINASKEKSITRIGDSEKIDADVRIIASTYLDIKQINIEKRIHPELLQQSKTLHIHIPALRERMEDMRELVTHLVRLSSLELKHQEIEIPEEVFAGLMERAVIICKNNVLKIDDFRLNSRKISE